MSILILNGLVNGVMKNFFQSRPNKKWTPDS